MSGLDQLVVGLGGGGLARNTYLDMQAGQQEAQQRDQQLQAGRMQLDAVQQKQARDAGYQQDVLSYFSDPKPNALGALMLKYPDKADEIKQSKAVLDEPARQSQLTQFSSLHNAVENNRSDLARTLISNIHAAEKAKGIADPQVEDIIGQLDSKDPAVVASAMKQIKGFTQINLAALDPKFAEVLAKQGGEAYTLGQGQQRYDANNKLVASVAPKPDYLVVPEGGKAIPLNGAPSLGLEGGGQTSSGSAAGSRGDVSRLINSDAGGGYVPQSVGTLGQFVGFGKAMNRGGAKSSSAGTYQINGTTMAEFAPKVFGPDWKNAPFNADTQERVGEAIFEWAKQQRDPAAALRGRWVSLDPKTAARLVQGNWNQARSTIAQGETGGGAGASASRGSSAMSGDPAGTVYGAPKQKDAPSGYQWNPDGTMKPIPGGPADDEIGSAGGDPSLTGPAYLASLPVGRRAAIKAIAEGRAPAPNARTKAGQALLDSVSQYDPTFDAANATSRSRTRVDFTSGKSAQAVNALNTAMGHLLHLDEQAKNLGNFSTLPGWLNPIYNAGRQMNGDTKLPAFNQTKQAAASEMRKVFAGSSGGNLTELQEWQESLNSSQSYEQLHAAIKNGVTLMGSRLNALQDQYITGMGRSDNVPQLIKPQIAAAAKRRFGESLGHEGQGGTTSPSSGFRVLGVRKKP